ncbi:MAG TPA: GAF and ANTAR domain-containing protein [Mycobacteriales bacterium]
MVIRAEDLNASLARLEVLDGDPEPATVVRRVVDAATELFGVDGAGMLIIAPDEALHHIADTDEPSRALEEAQENLGDGPCVASYAADATVTVIDLRVDDRWPELAPVAELGVRSVLGVPVRMDGSPIGTLNVFRDRPHEWDDTERSALEAYGRVIADLLATSMARHRSDETARQLRHALEYRVPIERAIGYLMASTGVDATTAFIRLRSAARNSRRKIVDVAGETLAGKPLP